MTASIEGREGDPTATSVTWTVARGPGSHSRLASLQALERDTPGSLGSPLLVPYVGAVVAAIRADRPFGASSGLATVADCFDAHVAALKMARGLDDRVGAGDAV